MSDYVKDTYIRSVASIRYKVYKLIKEMKLYIEVKKELKKEKKNRIKFLKKYS